VPRRSVANFYGEPPPWLSGILFHLGTGYCDLDTLGNHADGDAVANLLRSASSRQHDSQRVKVLEPAVDSRKP
jgi:hypothetical protein